MRAGPSSTIFIAGAREHNLRGVSCEVPRGALTVIAGVSGSGKSSLAFDTLYAEGRRRFVESLSTYARQFLERIPRPDVDAIEGVPPAIAIEQRNSIRNARSTVGSITEVADHLRLLFAKVAEPHCPGCGEPVVRATASAAAAALMGQHVDKRVHVVADVALGRHAHATRRLAELRRDGWRRLFLGGRAVDIDELDALEVAASPTAPIVVDRLVLRPEDAPRLADALGNAFSLTGGQVAVYIEGEAQPVALDEGLCCPRCRRSLPAAEPRLFSSESPLGACPTCQGFGRIVGVNLARVVPDPSLDLRGGAITPWSTPGYADWHKLCLRGAKRAKVRTDVPFAELTAAERTYVLDGDEASGGEFPGVRGFFAWLETKRYKVHVRVLLARYRSYERCGDCRGHRLRPEAQAFRLPGAGYCIAEIQDLPIAELRETLRQLPAALGPQSAAMASPVLHAIEQRLACLDQVGLGYLSLSRRARTLSGGEAQRVSLASALGSGLTGTLYVLDEPSVGLHPRDTDRLVTVIRALCDRGNTVVVVEHDPTIVATADYVIELGPAAGANGGEIVFAGDVRGLLAASAYSPTGHALAHRSSGQLLARRVRARVAEPVAAPQPPSQLRRAAPARCTPAAPSAERAAVYRATAHKRPEEPPPTQFIELRGARIRNLKDVTVTLPLGRLTCVTGVSGSGKSTLIRDVLYAAAQQQSRAAGGAAGAGGDGATELTPAAGPSTRRDGDGLADGGDHGDYDGGLDAGYDAVLGLDQVEEVVLVDQSPPGRSTRSNPATYLGAWQVIRKLLAERAEAQTLGLGPEAFSFNVPGGRCEACRGLGVRTIEMHFLADLTLACDVCDGKRFLPKVLGVKLRGLNVAELLELTVDEALTLFADEPRLVNTLGPFAEVGLGYLRLGQPTATLSGGEAQRLKLALHLVPGDQPSDGDERSRTPSGKLVRGRPPGRTSAKTAKERRPGPSWRGKLFLFDEPTAGLHRRDVEVLYAALERILAAGHTVVCIEHNVDLIAVADHIVDLGPEGGAEGGHVVVTGSPQTVARCAESYTGKELRQLFAIGTSTATPLSSSAAHA
jgi:excinuclease ABC subunit A